MSTQTNRAQRLTPADHEAVGGWEWIGLGLCVVIGGWLRVTALGGRPLWTDEVTTLITSQRLFWEGLFNLQDPQPPLYQLLLRWLSDGPAPGESLVRAPACVAGVLAIPAAWWLGRTLLGWGLAGVATFLVAINPVLIAYSREARPYSLFVLTSILSMTFCYRLARRGGWGNSLGYGLATGLMFLSHYYAMFNLAGQLVFLMGDYLWGGGVRRQLGSVLGGLVAAGVVASPALVMFVWLLKSEMPGADWIARPSLIDGFDTMGDLLGLRALGVLCVIPLMSVFWWGRSALDGDERGGEAARVGLSSWLERCWGGRRGALLCALWIGFGLFVPLIGSIVYKPGFVMRYVIPVTVPVLVLGLLYLYALNRVVLAMVLLVLVGFNLPKAYRQTRPETGMRQVVQWVQANTDPSEAVYLADWAFCEGFINPEEKALGYYGLRGRAIHKLDVKALEGLTSLPMGVLLPPGRCHIVCFASTINPVKAYLIQQGRPFALVEFGNMLRVVRVQPGLASRVGLD